MTCQSIVKVYLPNHHPYSYQDLSPHHQQPIHETFVYAHDSHFQPPITQYHRM